MYNSEKEFLESYNMNKFERPTGYTSDIVIFTLVKTDDYDEEAKAFKRDLQVLLVKRRDYPGKGNWALPGGFVNKGETAYEGAIRELEEETGVSNIFLKHFGVYDSYGRDPRGNKWVISSAHYAIVNEKYLERRKAGSDAEEVKLFSFKELANLEFAFSDHKQIIDDAYRIVKKEMFETTLAKEFLEEEFLLSDLFITLKSINEFAVKKSNFFTKASKLAFLEFALDHNGNPKELRSNLSKRPARLYKFKKFNPQASIY